MKRIFLLSVAVALAASPIHGQSGNDLFQKALSKERAEGRLADAIILYQRIVAEFKADRPLAAKALLQIGRCYERLGKIDAQKTYERLLRDFADQRAVIDEARARLAALARPNGAAPAADVSPRARRLWEGQSAGQFLGSPSPDGRFISFVDWATLDVALWDVASGAQRRLTSDGLKAGGSPYWSRISPDGTQVVFAFFSDTGGSELRLVRVDNPAVKVVYRSDQLIYVQPFDWSPDGKRVLAALGMLDRTNRIAIVSLVDGSAQILKTLDWRAPVTASFSPDGRWIAYDLIQQESGRERDVYLLTSDGTRETRLVEHPADDSVLGWAPDGKTVLFASDRTGVPAAWAIEMADGRPARPPRFIRGDIGWRVVPMGFSRGGGFFYFVENAISDMYTASFDPASGRSSDVSAVGGRYSGTYESADWSPDGGQLALVVNRTGLPGRRLVVMPAGQGAAREFQPDLTMFTWPRWAPDGRSILVSGRDRKNRRGYFRVDAATGALDTLLREEAGSQLHMRAEWAHDGRSVFYVRKDSDCACVVRRDLQSDRDIEVDRMSPRGTLVLTAPSPDGRWIAVSTRDDARTFVKVLPLAGGDARVVAEGDTLKWFNFITWTPDSRELLIGRQPASGPRVEVWRVPVNGGAARPTTLAMDSLRNLRVHPDGRRVVFVSGQDKGEVWVMENFLPSSDAPPPAPPRRPKPRG